MTVEGCTFHMYLPSSTYLHMLHSFYQNISQKMLTYVLTSTTACHICVGPSQMRLCKRMTKNIISVNIEQHGNYKEAKEIWIIRDKDLSQIF